MRRAKVSAISAVERKLLSLLLRGVKITTRASLVRIKTLFQVSQRELRFVERSVRLVQNKVNRAPVSSRRSYDISPAVIKSEWNFRRILTSLTILAHVLCANVFNCSYWAPQARIVRIVSVLPGLAFGNDPFDCENPETEERKDAVTLMLLPALIIMRAAII